MHELESLDYPLCEWVVRCRVLGVTVCLGPSEKDGWAPPSRMEFV